MAVRCSRACLALAFLLAAFVNTSDSVCTSRSYRATTTYQYIRKYSYGNNEDCTFSISPSYNYYNYYFLEIQWYYRPAFSVNGVMPRCTTDYVEAFITSSYKSIGKYCSNNIGSYAPYTIFSHDGRARIKFHSDTSGTGSGFQLRFRLRRKSSYYAGSYYYARCYNTYQYKRSGIIYSSGYPRGYKKSTSSCTHKIYTGSNRETKLVFTDMDLSYYGSRTICSSYDDYVEVRGSDSSTATFSTSSIISGKMCTTSLIKTITTRKKYIFVYFRRPLGSKLTRRGFYMGYISYDLPVAVSTTAAPVTTAAVNTAPFVIKHIGGLCVAARTDGRLHLTSACNEVFFFMPSRALKHQKTNQCVVPESLVNDASFKLTSDCSTINARFQQTSSFSIKHIASGMCWRPEGGSNSPAVNTKVVIYTGCNEARLIFQIKYVNPTTFISSSTSSTQIAASSRISARSSVISVKPISTTILSTGMKSSSISQTSSMSSLPQIYSSTAVSRTNISLSSFAPISSTILSSTISLSKILSSSILSPKAGTSAKTESLKIHLSTKTKSIAKSKLLEEDILPTRTVTNRHFQTEATSSSAVVIFYPGNGERSTGNSKDSTSIIKIVVPAVGVLLALLIILVIARYFYRSRKRPKIVFGDTHLACKDSQSTNHYSKDPTKSTKSTKFDPSKDFPTSSPPVVPNRPSDLNIRKLGHLLGTDNSAFIVDGGPVSTPQVARMMRAQSFLVSAEDEEDINPENAPRVNAENAPEMDDSDEYLTAVQAGAHTIVSPGDNVVSSDAFEERKEYIEMKPIEATTESTTTKLSSPSEYEEQYLDLTTATKEPGKRVEEIPQEEEEHYLDLSAAAAEIEDDDPDSLYEDIDKFQKLPQKGIHPKPRSVTFDGGPCVPKSDKPRSRSVDLTNIRHNESEPALAALAQRYLPGQQNRIPHSSSSPPRPDERRAPCPPPSLGSETGRLQSRRESAPVIQPYMPSAMDQRRNRKVSVPAPSGFIEEDIPVNRPVFSRCQTITEDPAFANPPRSMPPSQYPDSFNPIFSCQGHPSDGYPTQGIAVPNTRHHQLHGVDQQATLSRPDQALVQPLHTAQMPYYLMAPASHSMPFQAPVITQGFYPGSVPYTIGMPYPGTAVAYMPGQGPASNQVYPSTQTMPPSIQTQQATNEIRQARANTQAENTTDGPTDGQKETIMDEPSSGNEFKHPVDANDNEAVGNEAEAAVGFVPNDLEKTDSKC